MEDREERPEEKVEKIPRDFFLEIQSDKISEIAGALSKAQGKIESAKRDSANPFFKSRYADLISVWNACRKHLTDNDISVVQTPIITEKGDKVLVTTMLHKSGQWFRSFLPIKPTKDDPQGMGSAITYMRRYALSAMTGVAPDDDDDGNNAYGKKDEREKPAGKAPAYVSGEVANEKQKSYAESLIKEVSAKIKPEAKIALEKEIATPTITKSRMSDIIDNLIKLKT